MTEPEGGRLRSTGPFLASLRRGGICISAKKRKVAAIVVGIWLLWRRPGRQYIRVPCDPHVHYHESRSPQPSRSKIRFWSAYPQKVQRAWLRGGSSNRGSQCVSPARCTCMRDVQVWPERRGLLSGTASGRYLTPPSSFFWFMGFA